MAPDKRKRQSKSSTSTSRSSSSSSSLLGFRRYKGLRNTIDYSINFEFTNHLPRPIIGPVFLPPPPSSHHVRSDVERWWSWRLHTEKDLGCPIETVDPGLYQFGKEGPMGADDEGIVNWQGAMGDTDGERLRLKREGKSVSKSNTSSSRQVNDWIGGALISLKSKNHPTRVLNDPTQFWMKKTTYLANDLHRRAHDHKSMIAQRNKKAEELDKDVEQSRTNNRDPSVSFQHAPITKHPTKPDLKVVSSIPLLPSSKTWPNSYVVADIPAPTDNSNPANLSTSFITDVSPKDSQSSKLVCSVFAGEDEPGVKELWRQYDIDVIPLRDDETAPDTHFVIAVHDDVAYYQPITARVVCSTGRVGKGRERRRVRRRGQTGEEKGEWDRAQAEMDRDTEERIMQELGGHA